MERTGKSIPINKVLKLIRTLSIFNILVHCSLYWLSQFYFITLININIFYNFMNRTFGTYKSS